MPEGPEVRRLVDQISSEVVGLRITNAEVLSGRYYNKKSPVGWSQFNKAFPQYGSPDSSFYTIEAVNCKGKFIWFELRLPNGTPCFIWNTLGMSGGWSYSSDKIAHKHARVRLYIHGNLPQAKFLDFVDMRNFGTLHFYFGEEGSKLLEKKLKTLGPDLLQVKLSDEKFKNQMMYYSLNKTLPEALMNQKAFAGVGNYLKAEALYLAELSPHRKVSSLSNNEFSALNKAVTELIRESYKSGGSTFRVYQDLYGNTGNFSDRFVVYGRKTDPNGNPVEKLKTKDGRTTHWVPAIQK